MPEAGGRETCRARQARTLLAAALISLAASAAHAEAVPCAIAAPCAVFDGFYLARPPPAWDGKAPLAAMIFFHGHRGSAEDTLADPLLAPWAARNGILLVAAHGKENTWSHPGSPSKFRDELAYVRSLLADVRQRYPVDEKRLVAAGFSAGGSVVWSLACQLDFRFAAYLPFAGGFWDPLPERCAAGAGNVFHVHGTSDTTVPLAGRWIRNTWKQGDIHAGFKRFIAANACAAPPRSEQKSDLACTHYAGCGSGKALSLCLHPEGHSIRESDIDAAWAWVKALP